MTQIITAVFDSQAAADRAERDLQQTGIPTSMIARYAPAGADQGYGQTTPVTGTQPRRGGVLGWLMGDDESNVSQTTTTGTGRYMPSHFGMTDAEFADHGEAYENHVRLGHVVMRLSPQTQTEVDQIMAVLERHQPDELHTDSNDDLATTRPIQDSSFTNQPTMAATTGLGGATVANTPREELSDRTVGGTTNYGTQTRQGEEVIPLSEEKVNIGTRRVDRGTTHIRRYVVETPVEKNVVLHDETTSIERRAPLGNTQPGTGAFEDRTVEVRETSEVADVSKSARVVEEVVVNRAATERTETVRDVERKEEVEITKDASKTVYPDSPTDQRAETLRETDRKSGIV